MDRWCASIALVAAGAAGCPTPRNPPPPTPAVADAAVAEPAAPPDAGPAPAAAPDRAECEQLVDHVLAVGMADQRRRKPPELVPTDEQVAVIRARLLEEQLDACLAMPREQWDCMMAAGDQDRLYGCAD